MILRLTIGVAFLILAAEEFFRAGPGAAELVRKPGDLVEALLSGDGAVGPWLLAAYGVLMVVRAWAHRGQASHSDNVVPGPRRRS